MTTGLPSRSLTTNQQVGRPMTTLRTPKNPSGPVDVTVVSLDQTGADRLAALGQASAETLVAGKPVREFRMPMLAPATGSPLTAPH